MPLPDDFVPGQVIAAADINAIKDEVALKLDEADATATYAAPASIVVRASDTKGTRGANFSCDGTDDQTTINSALALASITKGKVLLLAGTYNISGSIVIDRSHVALVGELMGFWDGFVAGGSSTAAATSAEGAGGTKIKASTTGFNLISLDGTTQVGTDPRLKGVEVRNLYLYGASKLAAGGTGIYGRDAGFANDQLVIDRVFVHNTYVGMDIGCDAGHITRNTVMDCGNVGIALGVVGGSAYTYVGDNIVADVGGDGILVIGGLVSGVMLVNNTLARCLSGILTSNVGEAIITGNQVALCRENGIQVNGKSVVANNSVLNCLYEQIKLVAGTGSIVHDNLVRGGAAAKAQILVGACPRVNVHDNDVEVNATTGSGLTVGTSPGARVHDNAVTRTGVAGAVGTTGLSVDAASVHTYGKVADNFVVGAFATALSLPTASAAGLVSNNKAVTVSDSFTRADSALTLGSADSAQAWTAMSGTWGITSNQAYIVAGAAQNYAVIDTGSTDVTVEATVTGSSAADQGLALRMGATIGDGMFLNFNSGGNTVQFYKFVASAATSLGSAVSAVSVGDRFRVTVVGNLYTIYKNGVQLFQATDAANNANTKHGMWGFGVAAAGVRQWDSFSIVTPS